MIYHAFLQDKVGLELPFPQKMKQIQQDSNDVIAEVFLTCTEPPDINYAPPLCRANDLSGSE